jgi:hypothetical protein
MQIPQTSAPQYLFLDPDPAFIFLNGTSALTSASGVAGTLQISAALNKVGNQGILAPDTSTTTTQPGWSKIGITTPYYTTDWPGSYYVSGAPGTASVPAITGTAGFTFANAQYLSCDAIASTFSGTSVGITVVCVVQASAGSNATNTVWELNANTGSPSLRLSFNTAGTTATFQDSSSGGAVSQAGLVAGTAYVITATRSASGLLMRITAATSTTNPLALTQTQTSGAYTPSSLTYSTFTVGASNTGTTTSPTIANKFTGSIGQLMVFGIGAGQTITSGGNTYPCADIENVETDMLIEAGILLGDVVQG